MLARPLPRTLALALLFACTGPADADKAGDSGDPGDSGGDSAADSGGADSGGDSGGADSGDSGGGDSGDSAPASLGPLTLTVDADVVTILHATFADNGADSAVVEYRFDGGDWLEAPLVGVGEAVLLGLPADTAVEARAVGRFGQGGFAYSDDATAMTGSLPAELLSPTLVAWDASLSDAAAFVMVSVDHGRTTYAPPYWVEILDRQGRVVWYHEVPDDLMSLSPTVARDGTHVWWDEMDMFFLVAAEPRVVRATLDGRWREALAVPDMGQAVAEGPDGAFFYERRGASPAGVARVEPDGAGATVWDCEAWLGAYGYPASECRLNACTYDPDRDTVLASSFAADTVFEVDATTGEVLRQLGQLPEGDPYGFEPEEATFDYQHYPHWLPGGTLLVSTHVLGHYGTQIAGEYEVDDAGHLARRVWAYESPDRFATQLGEALRLPNGNTVQGYGEDGAIREVTPDGAVAWEVEWPLDGSGKRVLGHASFIEDLYALNVGPSAE